MRANWSSSTLSLRPRPGTQPFSPDGCHARLESTQMKFFGRATLRLCRSCAIEPRVSLLSTVRPSTVKAVRSRPCIRTWPRLLTSGEQHIPMDVCSVSRLKIAAHCLAAVDIPISCCGSTPNRPAWSAQPRLPRPEHCPHGRRAQEAAGLWPISCRLPGHWKARSAPGSRGHAYPMTITRASRRTSSGTTFPT